MKVNILNKYEVFDNKISDFTPRIINEDEYNLFNKLCRNGYIVTNKWVLYAYQKKYKDNTLYYLLAISTYFEVVSCQQDIHTSERFYCIRLFNGKDTIDINLDSSVLTSSGVKRLLQHGCIFDESNLKYVLSYLSVSACKADIQFVHSKIGWIFNREPVFLSSKSYSKSYFESKYIGELDLIPKGSIDNTLSMIKNEVLGNPMLEFSIVLACSAPVLGYLNNYFDLGCLIVNYGNCSSKGKTTAGMLIASIFGSPVYGKSLMSTMCGTENALLTYVSSADSHPVVLYELSMLSTKNIRKLLYQFASGKEKSRNNKEGNIKKSKTFNNIIVTTSEYPILDSNAPDGLRTRIFQISSDITRSADNSDAIKNCVYLNYGHIGEKFIEYIISEKIHSIVDDYQDSYTELIGIYNKKELGIVNLTRRILSKLAVVLLTAKYFNGCFEVKIDLNHLVKTLIQLERNVADDMSIEDRALDCIVQYVSTHKNHFIFGCDDWISAVEGKINVGNGTKEIIILKSVVEKILKENDFENPKIIYQKWSDKKILSREKDRPYKRLILTHKLPKQPCFIFKLPE